MTAGQPDASESEALDVVFVCTGNRARSPLAAAFLTELVEPRRVKVSSRGTLEAASMPALREAVAAGSGRGIDLSEHRSTSMRSGELARVDLVVGFESFHVAAAVADGRAPYARTFTILELAEIVGRLDQNGFLPTGSDPRAVVAKAHGARRGSALSAPSLADPLGASQREFNRVAATIEQSVTTIAGALFGSRTQ